MMRLRKNNNYDGLFYVWAICQMSMAMACFDNSSALQKSTYASTSLGLDNKSWPSIVAQDSTNVELVSHWFEGAYIEKAPQAIIEAKKLVESQLEQIMAKTYCYQKQDGPSLKPEDVFLATFGQYTDNFVNVGKILFGPAFDHDAKVSFVPKHQLHYPAGWGECSLGSVTHPHSGSSTLMAFEPNHGNQAYELPKELLLENIPISGSDNITYKNYVEWLRSLPIVWPHKLRAGVSPPILMPYKTFKVTMLRRTLGAVLDDTVRDSHRLHPSKRMQVLYKIFGSGEKLGLIHHLPVKTRVNAIDDLLIYISPDDGSIARIIYGNHDYTAITVGKHCLTKGTKDHDFQSIADELQTFSARPGAVSIKPGVCVADVTMPPHVGPSNPVFGGFIREGMTSYRREDVSGNEGEFQDYVLAPVVRTYFNVPSLPKPSDTATDCSQINSMVGKNTSNCAFQAKSDLRIFLLGGKLTNFGIVSNAEFVFEYFDSNKNITINDSMMMASQNVGDNKIFFQVTDPYCPPKGAPFSLDEIPMLLQKKGTNRMETSVLYKEEYAHEFYVRSIKKNNAESSVADTCIFFHKNTTNDGGWFEISTR